MKNEQPGSAQPAAYDAEGRPLYYQPPVEEYRPEQPHSTVKTKPESIEGYNFNPQIRTQYANEPDYVHTKREYEPKVSDVSEDLKRKHDESVSRFPSLNLSEGEYVILKINRHPIGLLLPCLFTAISLVVLTTLLLLVPDLFASQGVSSPATTFLLSQGSVSALLLVMMLVSALIGGVAIWVYQQNHFYLTNESIVQEIQHSLFSRHEQTVSLGSIEDASFKRQGILQHIFNYGTMRLSTEGEETTYQFAYVEDPKRQIATVNDAVESFKNGRPVEDDQN